MASAEFATLDGKRVFYHASGSGPALVLVHGWTCDSTFWSRQQPALSKQFRVVALDLPGHGKSDPFEGPYDSKLFARGVMAVMDAAKVDRAVLAGHSMGTPVIRHVLEDAPKRVLGLIAVDGAVVPPSQVSGFGSKVKEWAESMRGPAGLEVRRKFIEGMLTSATTPDLRKEILSKMLATPEDVAASAMANAILTDLWSRQVTEVPVLALVRKSKDERVHATYKEVFAHLTFEEVEDASHFLHMERPDLVNQRIAEFVKRVSK
jgi:pimeloyl-ACP methyl ester carboxylesterase